MGQVTSSGRLRQPDERCRGGAEETGVTEASPGALPASDRISTEQDGPESAMFSRAGGAVADSCSQINGATIDWWIPLREHM